MTIRTLPSTIVAASLLLTSMVGTNPQINAQAAREEATEIVRSKLQSTVQFKADQFLSTERKEELEQVLGMAVGGQAGLFVYKISPEGVELRRQAVVYHTWSDVDPVFIVVVNPKDGSAYRVHGFGREESLTQFENLMTALKLHLASSDQAEALAEFYRKVNPENYDDLTPISTLMELKQSAERQCQSGAKSFDSGEAAFDAWWKDARHLYAAMPFQQKAVPYARGYRVEWVTLSSPSSGSCAGAPLKTLLDVGSDGHVDKLAFSPVRKGK